MLENLILMKKKKWKCKVFRESFSRNHCFRNRWVIDQALQSKNSETLGDGALWNSPRERKPWYICLHIYHPVK